MKNGSSAAWGPGVWPKKCFWKGWVALIALQIQNKILTTQLYLAHELAFMFTKEACNLWTKSYLLLSKINSAVKALCEEEKMPKSRTVAHTWVSCTDMMDAAAFSLCAAAHMAVRYFSVLFQLPGVGCWRGSRAEKGQSVGWKHRMRAAGSTVMTGLRGRQQKRTLHAPCAMSLALHNRPKWKSTFGFFLGSPCQRHKKKPVCMLLLGIC